MIIELDEIFSLHSSNASDFFQTLIFRVGSINSAATGDNLVWLIVGIGALILGGLYVFLKSKYLSQDYASHQKRRNIEKYKLLAVGVISITICCICLCIFINKN